MASYRDALGREIEVRGGPNRIVSLVPSITEALFAFGIGDRVAGVTRFCVEPPGGVARKPRVGGTKNVVIQEVLALHPDLVIANQEENTFEDVQHLIDAGLTVFVTYPRTVSSAITEMRLLAAMTGSQPVAAPILDEAQDYLLRAAAANKTRRPVRVFCPIWRNPWMTIGPDTYMHDLIAACGGDNVFGDSTERYPKTRLADVAERQPEGVLLPDEPYKFAEKHVPEVAEVLGEVPAVRDGRIYLVDGKYLCWYGPRIGRAIRYLQGLLHGEERV